MFSSVVGVSREGDWKRNETMKDLTLPETRNLVEDSRVQLQVVLTQHRASQRPLTLTNEQEQELVKAVEALKTFDRLVLGF